MAADRRGPSHPSGVTLRYSVSRRRLLRLAGLGGVSLLAPGCGGGSGSDSSPVGGVTPTPVPTPAPAPAPTPTPAPTPQGTQFGVNYYDLYHRFITNAAPFDPERQLQPLSDRGLRVVRFAASPLWSRDWMLWNGDSPRYLAALDRLFDAADKLGMKLVPVLMSAPFGLSDLVGEPFSAWGNAGSATRRAFDEFIPPMVERYRTRSSLLMWELSNEMNGFVNDPDGYKEYPPVDPAGGKPRTAADNLTSDDVHGVHTRFAELVRQKDTGHPISSGSTIPNNVQIRRAANLAGLDSREDLKLALEQSLAGNLEVLSIHLYDAVASDRFDPTGSNFGEILGLARAVADKKGVKLYLGEFGVPRSTDEAADKANFRRMLADIKAAKVDYATAWCYDWMHGPQWNITVTNDRSWMLDDMVSANG